MLAFTRWVQSGAAIGSVLLGLAGHPAWAQDDFSETLAPFFANYCGDCHSGGADDGGLDLDSLSTDLSDPAAFASWERIFDRVVEREMPPEDSDRVTDSHHAAFTRLLGNPLFKAHAAQKGTVFRRLNRREYQNTMNDLFGTNLDLEVTLPEDGRTGEFDNVGESLSMSSVQLQRYLDAVDAVMDAAIAKTTEPVKPTVKQANYADTREGEKHIGSAWKLADDGAVVFFRALGYPTGMLRTADARVAGRYRIRITGYAYQSDKPVTMEIGATTFQRGMENPTFAYREMPPGKPTTIEIEAHMDARYMLKITPWGINDPDYLIKKNGIETYPGPGLAILNVAMEGPLVDEFPSRGHKLLFEGMERREIEPNPPSIKKKSWYVPKFEIADESDDQAVREGLHRIAAAAFRRPVKAAETQRYVDLFDAQRERGESYEDAYRTAAAAILCSPDFLYLQESPGRLDDYALASRLSYFLTRTAPDKPLLQAAAEGKLSGDSGELARHVDRLLSDPRHERFLVDFTDAWLNLRDIDFTAPDRTLFPEYDAFLQFSALQETRQFVGELIRKNLSVRNLVQSDFAMLNNRLGMHYEIDGVDGPRLRRFELPHDSPRGGLLSQTSVLKVSANGTNTSPVVRGVWVLERIMGVTPPPPPPGIPGVEPDIRGASTLRELLDKHRNVDSCRSCHTMIDPPGFALESFDPIGGWRDRFRSLGEGEKVKRVVHGNKVRYRLGPKVDAAGVTKDGRKFSGFRDFRRVLAGDQDRLARTLATKLLTFATGREMGFSDRVMIDRIVKESAQSGYGVRDLIHAVVRSEAFLTK